MNNTTARPIVIIGTGLAGYNLAKEFRKLSPTQELVLITQDDGHFYSKPQLSTAISQNKNPAQLVVTDVDTMRTQLAATIHTFSTVTNIDPQAKTITLHKDHETLSIEYSKLVLALGAIPNPFTLPNDADHFRINNLVSYADFLTDHPQRQHVTIVGSGLVGCEFAHDFSHAGAKVSVITPEPWPLYRLVPQAVGIALQQALMSKGVEWHGETTIANVEIQESALDVELSNGTQFTTCAVLSAIGLKPNLHLAQLANLEIKQGIVVDENLQTSDPNIYALGDCAEILGETRMFVAPILACARALAQTLNGQLTPVKLMTMPIVLKVSSYPITIMPAAQNTTGEWQIEETETGIKALFVDEDQTLLGYILTGTCIALRSQLHPLLNTKLLQTSEV